MKAIVGLHHVTAFASNPQRNLDFYTGVLGQRFVKKTVNFDDPGTYHFYFGDDAGSPGTIYTSRCPWPSAARGTVGAGKTTHIAYSVPRKSIEYWFTRLQSLGVSATRGARFDGEEVLVFADPDGMGLEIVGYDPATEITPPRFADVPTEHALRGLFGATLLQRELAAVEPTLRLMGFHPVAHEGPRTRFAPEGDAHGRFIDIVANPAAPRGRMGAGSVHHIAFRAADDLSQLEWRQQIEKTLSVTAVQERDYFRSIYFREPEGVLFELATDPPGFTLDEPLESLGETLCTPEWLASRRFAIEASLLPITLHKAGAAS